MTWKGAIFLVGLILALGGVLAYSDPGLKPRLLKTFNIAQDQAAVVAQDKSSAAKSEGGAAPGDDFEKGPQNGRLLRDGDFAIEVTIFETGVPPEFRLYGYEKDKLVIPSEIEATVELKRLDGDVDRFTFAAQADYLRGNARVVEPHSFDVTVKAKYRGQSHLWTYSSPEGRTEITEEAAAALSVELAGPAWLEETVVLTGSVALNQNRVAQVKARFPGVVRHVRKNVGEAVKEGDVLAVVESNTSLLPYDVKAPFAGVVLERGTNLGDVTGDAALFVIADLSTVWAEFHVFSRDLERVKAGQPIRVKNVQGNGEAESVVTIFTPVAEMSSQSVIARVTLDNADARWRPGMTVRGEVVIAKRHVPLAVKTSALQRFRDFTVIFAKFGTTYEVRMLELGAKDGTWNEVKGGLKPGTAYVTENSFLVKADIEKSGATHDH